MTGKTTVFASRADQRFSYCLYVPDRDRTLPLIVIMHGTARGNITYRDAFADFAEKHDVAILAPLFPAGIGDDPDDLHNYKFIDYQGIRFDQVLLDIVEEAGQRFDVETGRFALHGFSGGGQFTHRFLYLHPDRLWAASIGAPGRVTLLDPEQEWWLGTKGAKERFGLEIDPEKIREVPVQMVVGGKDIETWEINNPGHSNWLDGAEKTGNTRIERLRTLQRSFESHGIDVRFDVVPGVAHDGHAVLPAVQDFFAENLK